MGSAQQYQGSVKYGIAARATSGAPSAFGLRPSAFRGSANAAHRLEHLPSGRGHVAAHQRLDLVLKAIDVRIRVPPRMRERARVERTGDGANLRQFQERRPLRHEQPDRQLNRRDVLDQIEPLDLVEQIDVGLLRGPGREGHERRRQRDTRFTAQRHGAFEVRPRMPFFQPGEHVVVNRLDRAGDERAARGLELRQCRGVIDQVLDLDRHVVGQPRMLARQRANDAQRMRDAVEEIRVSERDVPGAGADLRPDVGQDDIRGHRAEAPVVHGHDRTMAAQMLAAAARLGVANRPRRAVGHPQLRVLLQRGQAGAIGRLETDARECSGTTLQGLASQYPDEAEASYHMPRRQDPPRIPARGRSRPSLAQQRLVQRRVEPVRAQPHRRIQRANAVDDGQRHPRGGVHREKEGDEVGVANGFFRKSASRQIDARHLGARVPQPGRGDARPNGWRPSS